VRRQAGRSRWISQVADKFERQRVWNFKTNQK